MFLNLPPLVYRTILNHIKLPFLVINNILRSNNTKLNNLNGRNYNKQTSLFKSNKIKPHGLFLMILLWEYKSIEKNERASAKKIPPHFLRNFR